jgi:hypothetical protein
MTLMIVLFVAFLQLLATIALYGSGVIRTLGLREGMTEIVLVFPSVTAFVVDGIVIFASPLFRTHRVGTRLTLVLCCSVTVVPEGFAGSNPTG